MYLCELRGWRNNNPGNIADSEIIWNGEKSTNEDKRFEEFESPEYGIRALAKILINYQKLHGLNTVEQMINRYAPTFENDTDSYIEHVSNEMQLNRHDEFDITDGSYLVRMVKVIIKHELGIQPYSDELIENVMEKLNE